MKRGNNRKIWKRQLEHNKREFLNFDEYGKTIFDYALENKNYALIQFIKENDLFELNDSELRYSWISEQNNPDEIIGINDKFGEYFNSAVYYQIADNDYYRSQLTAMAVERNDIDILEFIKARESRKLGNSGVINYDKKDQVLFESELMSIVLTDNEKVIDYFTGEYRKKNPFGWKNDDTCYSMLVYNYIGEIAENLSKSTAEYLGVPFRSPVE